MTYAVATETLAADYESGLSIRAISRKRNITTWPIRRRLRMAGVDLRPFRDADTVDRRLVDLHVRHCTAAAALLRAAPGASEIMQRLNAVITGTEE